MSSIMKFLPFLALMVCISKAQLHDSGQCLCHTLRPKVNGLISEIKDIQIYKETIFCNKVEIVITMNSGLRYCLNPQLGIGKRLINSISSKNKSTLSPTGISSTSGSKTTHMRLSV